MIYQSLLNIYVNNPDRDGDEPPMPESRAEILASRCTKFESSDIKIDTSAPSEQQKQEQYSRSVLNMTQQFRAINIIVKATTKEVFTCIKMDVNTFVVVVKGCYLS